MKRASLMRPKMPKKYDNICEKFYFIDFHLYKNTVQFLVPTRNKIAFDFLGRERTIVELIWEESRE